MHLFLEFIIISIQLSDCILHLIDDYMFFAKDAKTCNKYLQTFVMLCESLNIPIKYEKTVLPSQVIELHGVEVDLVNMEMRLPPDKLEKGLRILQYICVRDTTTLKEYQSMLGFLNWCSKAVIPGRAFLRNLYKAQFRSKAYRQSHHIHFSRQDKADMATWYQFLQQYNGRSIISPHEWQSADTLHYHSDASSFAT